MICSAFRPSDDATTFSYLIPANFFAVESLRQLAALVKAVRDDQAFATECLELADEVHRALKENSTVQHKVHGEILAYEVDGYGSCLLTDDANVPSLL